MNLLFEEFLQREGVDLMSAPKVVVMDNSTATIKVGLELGPPAYPTAQNPSAANAPGGLQNPPTGAPAPSVPVGLVATIVPHIKSDGIHFSLKLSESKLVAAPGPNGIITDTKQLVTEGVLLNGETVYFDLGSVAGEKRKYVAFLTLNLIGPGGPEAAPAMTESWRWPDSNFERIQPGMTQSETNGIIGAPLKEEKDGNRRITAFYGTPGSWVNPGSTGNFNNPHPIGSIDSPSENERFQLVFGADGKLVSKDDFLALWLKNVPHSQPQESATPPTKPPIVAQIRQYLDDRIRADPEAWAAFSPLGI